MADYKWHQLSGEAALGAVSSSLSGLSPDEVKDRRLKFGPNRLQSRKKASPFLIFLRQFLSPLIYVLLAAVVISMVLGDFFDARVILGVLLINAGIGFFEETRAEDAMKALSRMAAPRAKVRRGGQLMVIPAAELVPGDIFFLETGDKVPADGRLLEVSNLKLNEDALTGESMPVEKHTGVLGGELPLGDRKNLVFTGTVVTYGRATAAAVHTGMATEIGKIATGLLEVKPQPTPLQQNIARMSRYIIILFLGVVAVLALVGWLRGLGVLEIFLLAVAAAVSAIPEGLPAVVTVVLAIGMRSMAKRNAVVRRLVAVETLGSATVICSDKTGTLTLNEMAVRRIYAAGRWFDVSGEGYLPTGDFRKDGSIIKPDSEPDLALHLHIGMLCNDALLTAAGDRAGILGDPTEGALVVAAAKAGISKESLESRFPRLDEIPFLSENQYMATLHPRESGGRVVYVKGSTERLLNLSAFTREGGGLRPLGEAERQSISAASEAMAGGALRVIATAYRELPDGEDGITEQDIKELVLVGLSGMEDPPREEAKEAIRLSHQAGIKVVMITGDHKLTAESIARQLGLPEGRTITGADMAVMSDETLAREVGQVSVFARIEPLHKLRIVNALKAGGAVVAMTGDGVNDAPALKAADIGVAMGITGTDVAKEASDMILADDNFASVVAAVDEGRAIFNRLRNVLFFLLSTNLGELFALLASIFFLGQSPLLAVQIVWVNLVTDTAGAVPLGMEPKSGNELRQPPRHPRVGIIYPGLIFRIGFFAVMMGAGTFLVFVWARDRFGLDEARTIAFCTMVVYQWFSAFSARSDEYSVFRLGLWRNRSLVVAILIAVALQMAAVYLPFFQKAFTTFPLGARDWLVVAAAAASLFVVEEIRKAFFPRLFSLGKWQPRG